jgi:F-type H+-transporting ATPase subunit a
MARGEQPLVDRTVYPFRVRAPIAIWAAVAVGLAVSGVVGHALFPSAFEVPGRGVGLGFTLRPDELGTVAGIPVTNTLLSCWLATVLIVGFALIARALAAYGHPGMVTAFAVPIEAFWRFVTGLVDPAFATPLFTIAGSAVLFILANAWIASLPFYGPFYVTSATGDTVPLLRGAGSDINMSLALALTGGLAVQVLGFYRLRLAYIDRFFRVHLLLKGRLIAGLADFLAGIFELFLETTRVLSFTFRLFGSLTAGEVLILVISFIAPLAVVVPFYGLELLIGAVQAWIFGSLIAVFSAAAMGSGTTGNGLPKGHPRDRHSPIDGIR